MGEKYINEICVLLRTRLFLLKIKCPKQNFKIVFILFKIVSELKNIKQDDVKYEAKEKHFKTELLDLEEAPKYQMAAKDSETIRLLEVSDAAKGKLNPKGPGGKGLQKLPSVCYCSHLVYN